MLQRIQMQSLHILLLYSIVCELTISWSFFNLFPDYKFTRLYHLILNKVRTWRQLLKILKRSSSDYGYMISQCLTNGIQQNINASLVSIISSISVTSVSSYGPSEDYFDGQEVSVLGCFNYKPCKL